MTNTDEKYIEIIDALTDALLRIKAQNGRSICVYVGQEEFLLLKRNVRTQDFFQLEEDEEIRGAVFGLPMYRVDSQNHFRVGYALDRSRSAALSYEEVELKEQHERRLDAAKAGGAELRHYPKRKKRHD